MCNLVNIKMSYCSHEKSKWEIKKFRRSKPHCEINLMRKLTI